MNRKFNIFFAAMMTAIPLAASGQPYRTVMERNLWNMGPGAVGMRQDTVSISYAEAYGRYTGGGFRDTYEAVDSWDAGVRAESTVHLQRFSMRGAAAFNQFWGNEMCGSIFLKPGFYPIDAQEFTPGRKSSQRYSFEGGVCIDLSDNWRIGAKAGFTSTNIAKRKDLRHTGYRLDLDVVPGIQYHNGDFAIGMNYIFRRNRENENVEQVGTKVSSHYAFLETGIAIGRYGLWEDSSLHLAEDGVKGFPVMENAHGVNLQVSAGGFYADAEFCFTSGEAGEKQFIWFRFPGNTAALRLGYAFSGRNIVRMSFCGNRQHNFETSLEKVTKGGVTTVEEIGSNRILGREGFSVIPEYSHIGRKAEIRVKGFFESSDATASPMYPFLFKRNLIRYGADAGALLHLSPWDLGLTVGLALGRTKDETSSVGEDSGVISAPYRYEEYDRAHIDFLTSPALSLGMSARYNFKCRLYAETAAGIISRAGEPFYDRIRFSATLKFGYNF